MKYYVYTQNNINNIKVLKNKYIYIFINKIFFALNIHMYIYIFNILSIFNILNILELFKKRPYIF